MDLSHICKIIGHFIFQQSQHSEIMTIIYLINHSTNKLFNEVWKRNSTLAVAWFNRILLMIDIKDPVEVIDFVGQ